MKKVLLVCVLAAVILIPAFSETSGTGKYKNAVAIDPIWMLANMYKGSYERVILDQVTVMADVCYSPKVAWGIGYSYDGYDADKVTYLALVGEGRYYFGHFLKEAAAEVDLGNYGKHLTRLFTDGPGGFYVGAFASYKSDRVEGTDALGSFKAVGTGFGGGLELGCKYIFGERNVAFFLEPYAQFELLGGSYKYEDENGNSRSKPSGFEDGFSSGVRPGLKVGVVF